MALAFALAATVSFAAGESDSAGAAGPSARRGADRGTVDQRSGGGHTSAHPPFHYLGQPPASLSSPPSTSHTGRRCRQQAHKWVTTW
jgi:hypothetical protein